VDLKTLGVLGRCHLLRMVSDEQVERGDSHVLLRELHGRLRHWRNIRYKLNVILEGHEDGYEMFLHGYQDEAIVVGILFQNVDAELVSHEQIGLLNK